MARDLGVAQENTSRVATGNSLCARAAPVASPHGPIERSMLHACRSPAHCAALCLHRLAERPACAATVAARAQQRKAETADTAKSS